MPKRRQATDDVGGDALDRTGSAVTRVVVLIVEVGVPVAGLLIMIWLAYDAFQVSAEAGARSLCAALLPMVMAAYLRFVRPDWLATLDKVSNVGIMAGAGVATIAVLTVLSAGEGANVVPQFAISFAFSAMLLVGRGGERERRKKSEEQYLHFVFGIAIALLLYGLFSLEG